ACEGKHAHHIADIAAALSRRKDIADDRLRRCHKPARPDALEAAADYELQHRLRGAGQDRADHEDDDRGLIEPLAAVEVADFAINWDSDRRSEQIGRYYPREVLQAVELADDSR